MSAAANYASTLRIAVALILIITLTIPPPISVYGGSSSSISSSSRGRVEEISRKKGGVLGSRPPGCMNKCMNCRPCEATLVIPPHHQQPYSHRDDDTYYLLSWKCRCGNQLFHP